MAMGCSTNALIHLLALARRAGHAEFGLEDFDRASREVPVIGNVRPSGTTYLMEDFYYAGGIRALMERIRGHLDTGAITCTGRSVGENIAGAQVFNDDVIRPLDNPLYAEGALAVLRGNLAPEGCVIKPSAMEPRFLKHAGPALVFDDYPSMKKAVDDENLDVTADHVLVLRNAGPQGGPGMPEWGMLPMPRKLLKQGHRDMLRLSDARMSGTILWRLRAARVARELRRRAAGAAAHRRHRRDRRALAPDQHARLRGGAGPPPRRLDAAAAALRPRLWLDVQSPHPAGE